MGDITFTVFIHVNQSLDQYDS